MKRQLGQLGSAHVLIDVAGRERPRMELWHLAVAAEMPLSYPKSGLTGMFHAPASCSGPRVGRLCHQLCSVGPAGC